MNARYNVEILPWSSPLSESMAAIRMRVFVQEQGVPAELELDAIDTTAVHALARDTAGTPAGTGRLFPDAEDPAWAHIGRMAVLPAHRGCGCGAAILDALVCHARELNYHGVILSAQTHAAGFYQRFGFEPVGDVYLDCEIPHQDMRLQFKNQKSNESQ